MVVPTPNTGPTKFLWAGGGLLAGTGAAFGIHRNFVTKEQAEELTKADGDSRMSGAETRMYGMAGATGLAAGISLGLAKRSPTAGLTTAAHLTTGALLSTVAGATINPGKADDYMFGLAVMGASVGVGALASVRDEWHRVPVRGASLALIGAAVGMTLPTVAPMLWDKAAACWRGATDG